MPRQRKSRRNCLDLARLIHRARHHPYHLRDSTMRRGLPHGLWNANMAAYSLATTLSTSRSIRQQRRTPRVRMPSAIGDMSVGHLHLADVQISEPQRSQRSQRTHRKRRCSSMPLRDNLSTIVLHRNPHFNALGVMRSVMLRLNSKEGNGKDASSIANEQAAVDSAPKVKVEPQDTTPARKKLKPKKSHVSPDSAECSSDSSAGATRHAGAKQSASTSAGSSSNSKSSSAESNSFDGNNDEEAPIVAPLAMVPATKRMALKRKSPRTQELMPPAMPPVAHAATLGCPTLSAILLSVDNFLKRRRVSSNLR